MKLDVYIVTTKSGICRLTKREPDLARSEVAVKLQLHIPDENFKAPIFNTSIAVDKDDIIGGAPVSVALSRTGRRALDLPDLVLEDDEDSGC